MAESSSPSSNAATSRRGVPSPLVFNSETILPVSSSSNASSRAQTVNMPHVKRNITRRLKLAKQDCDAALYRIINNITQFIEEQIRNKQAEETQQQLLKESFDISLSDFLSRQDRGSYDTTSDDAGYDAEAEGRHSRQRSISSSPSLRRSIRLPTTHHQTSTDTSPRKISGDSNVWPAQSSSHSLRRLSRSIHVPLHSTPSSRSTSRSRSPLPSQPALPAQPGPGSSQLTQPLETPVTIVSPRPRNPDTLSQSSHSNRRHSRVFFDDPPAPDPFLMSLNELTTIATDICETSFSTLTSNPKMCHDLVVKVRTIGNAWDEHSDWPGRSWHMQILLALASLTRVVEWWEAENKFWNFSEEGDSGEAKDGEDEPFIFVLKPESEENDALKPSLPFAAGYQSPKEQDPKALVVRDEYRTRFSPSKPSSLSGRRSRDEQKGEHTPPSKQESLVQLIEPPRIQTAETLREAADFARYTTIVLELAADGDHVMSVNPAWRIVVGSEPDDLLRNGLSQFLHPEDWNTFKEACRDLQTDKGNTKEIRFKLLVEPDEDDDEERTEDPGPIYYCDMAGKGMLISNKTSSSHTVWVLKTLSPPREEYPSRGPIRVETGEIGGEPTPGELLRSFDTHRSTELEPITPFPLQYPISTSLILCRICECEVPEWYFEKHNESCNDVHRFEADIADCNETITELRSTVRDLSAALERVNPSSVPEYRGLQILSPGWSPGVGSPLTQARTHLSRMQRANVKRMQQRILDQLEDVLSMASEVSTPSLRDDETTEPIERQLLLSPGSVAKVESIRHWNKPITEDPALSKLIQDAEKVMFAKVDNVLRMRERIRYSELSRKIWEASVEEQLVRDNDESETENEAGPEVVENDSQLGHTSQSTGKFSRLVDDHNSVGSHSKSPSEYSCGREPEPTPLASSPMINPVAVREPVPYATFQAFTGAFGTRSSTPSSVSSPLALAVPITAPPPSLTLSPEFDPSRTVRTRRSTHALSVEPRLTLTPPLSPMVIATDTKSSGAHLRRHSTIHAMSPVTSSGPLSPRLSSSAPLSRTTPPSLKDFEIIKPISKGAFGSVFLAKKKVTGDYYAIKVLKKADMIAKNQITNVKHERMILMKQSESPFVAKLYFTFQSKEYLYLVMEYLNGGDCAALIKSLGSLPEEWTRNYIAEVVLGLEYLHKRGIVHRDLKPDNLLIDQHGHLKLTDFGLSRIGLLNRQARDTTFHVSRSASRSLARYSPSRPSSIDAASPFTSQVPTVADSYFNMRLNAHSSSHTILGSALSDDVSESSGSESLSGLFWKRGRPGESPLQSFATDLTTDLRSHSGIGTPPTDQRFVGTPDYLAPESILGISGDDPNVDWWALGVITYEFLYGIPPFHAETPEKVFANILSGQIEWHDDWVDFSSQARDFMEKLLVIDPSKRLGANGADEVKKHPFFTGVEWDKVTAQEAQFIPQVTDPESTDYFDPRGALPQLFQEDDERPKPVLSESPASDYLVTPPIPISSRDSNNSPIIDDFGAFSYKNLPVLKQANDDVIRKLKTEPKPEPKGVPIPSVLGLDTPAVVGRARSVSQRLKKPPSVITGVDKIGISQGGPPSPSTSASSLASSPSRASHIPALSNSNTTGTHVRRPSEYNAVERFKANQLEGEARRNSMPSRLRTASVSSVDQPSSTDSSDLWQRLPGQNDSVNQTLPISWGDKRTLHHASGDRVLTCLIVEDNPISQKILETVLVRMGCRCILAADGAEAISIALADIKIDCIFMDLHMPVVDGEEAARYIKSTNNKNNSTPIVAVSAYSGQDASGASSIFAASLAKPISKNELITVMRQLGFKTATNDGSKTTTKIAR